jgi:hypothetical protein
MFKTLLNILFLLVSFRVVCADFSSDIAEILFEPSEKFYDKTQSPLSVKLDASYIDNYVPLLASDISASSVSLFAKGNFVSKREAHWLEVKFNGKLNQYFLDQKDFEVDDNFAAIDIGITNRFFLTKRFAVDVNVSHRTLDEYIGTGISKFRSEISIADTVSINQGGVSLRYGADTDFRSVILSYSKSDRDYRDRNIYSELFDLEQDVISLYSSFRLSDLTQLIAQIEYRDLKYQFSSSLDSQFYKALTGFEWFPGGKSKVLALIGVYKRQYMSIDDSSGINWELAVDYFPREDFSINIASQRRSTSGESSELAVDTLEEDNKFEMVYRYSEQWWWGVFVENKKIDFQELANNRSTEEVNYGLSFRINVLDHSLIDMAIGSSHTQDDFNKTDFIQNRANISWLYEF